MRRDEAGDIEAFERGDVVWGIDPFDQDSATSTELSSSERTVTPRPWLVISDESTPFHPQQYLCLTLTTRTWHDDSIPLTDAHWLDGGAPAETSIMPWSVSAVHHEFLDTTGNLVARLAAVGTDAQPTDGYQGRLDSAIVDRAARRLRTYIDATMQS